MTTMRLLLAAADVTSRMALVAMAVAACGQERAEPSRADGPTWEAPVAALVSERCTRCHGSSGPAGGYDLTSYGGALGGGTDEVPNAIAGDPTSRILTILADDSHRDVADVADVLRSWVVDGRLARRASYIHGPGILDPGAPDFHGEVLRDESWSFATCQGCHGDGFDGGTSGAACTSCHQDGPTACVTCHRDGPRSGGHTVHLLGGALDRAVPCDACHRVPTRWDEPGHILDDRGVVDPLPAEVVLGALAARDVAPPRRDAPPRYDTATGTCSNVYCHGGVLDDGAAAFAAPTWNGPADQAACGGCHGAPPADHAQRSCAGCHPPAILATGATATHLDGVLQIGDGSGGCTACHGGVRGPAPPRALDGSTLPTSVVVGAHRSHLEAPGRLRAPIACEECHQVPATVDAPGHIDSDLPAEVFAAGVGVLARADAASPTWDRATATCSGVYCHGGGASLAGDTAPGRITTPTWTVVGRGEAACGRCHGLPPVDDVHDPAMTIATCTTCHPGVDAVGNILFTGPPGAETSEHIDGTVDLR